MLARSVDGAVSQETKGASDHTLFDTKGATPRLNSATERTLSAPADPRNGATGRTLSPGNGATTIAPNPSLSSDKSVVVARATTTTGPLPNDFAMPATWLEHAEREWRGIDADVEGERFVAWNRAQDKVSADWFATWQLWLEHVRGGERRSPDEDVVETGERAKAHPIDPEWGTVRDALQAECGADIPAASLRDYCSGVLTPRFTTGTPTIPRSATRWICGAATSSASLPGSQRRRTWWN